MLNITDILIHDLYPRIVMNNHITLPVNIIKVRDYCDARCRALVVATACVRV